MIKIKQKDFKSLGLEYVPLNFYDPELDSAPDVLPQIERREERYGSPLSPEKARITDSEKKALEALIKKGYEVYRNGWPDFLAVNPRTRKAFFVEVKSNGDVLSKKQIYLHNLLLDYFHLHVTVLRVTSGYIPDFVDPEFEVEKYHMMQLEKCKSKLQEIMESIDVERASLEQAKKEYREHKEENEKTIEEMKRAIDEQETEYRATESLLLKAYAQREQIEGIIKNINHIDDSIRTAFESFAYYAADEEKIVEMFNRYAENTTERLRKEKQDLENTIRNLKTMQKNTRKEDDS